MFCSRTCLVAGALLLRPGGSGYHLPESCLCPSAPWHCPSYGMSPTAQCPTDPQCQLLTRPQCICQIDFSQLPKEAGPGLSQPPRPSGLSPGVSGKAPDLLSGNSQNPRYMKMSCQTRSHPTPSAKALFASCGESQMTTKPSEPLSPGQAGILVPSPGVTTHSGSDPVPVSGSGLKRWTASTSWTLEHSTLGEARCPVRSSTTLGLPAVKKRKPGPCRGMRRERPNGPSCASPGTKCLSGGAFKAK